MTQLFNLLKLSACFFDNIWEKNMHAIVEIAGKQFRVQNNDKIKVPLLSAKEGDKINFDKVLMFENDKGNITFGMPVIDKMSVDATVMEHGREKKIIVFKKKRRKGYQKKNGHRQGFSLIEINEISETKTSPKKKETTKKAEASEKKPVAAKVVKKEKTGEVKKTTAKKTPAKKASPAKEPAAKKTTTAKPKAETKKTEPKAKAKEE